MNEPKKRGPKPKCKECGRKEGEGHYDDCSVGMGIADPIEREAMTLVRETIDANSLKAQVYALRVWEGQSITAPRPWRIERVKAALEGQGMSFDGVVLPEGDFFADLDREREENRK